MRASTASLMIAAAVSSAGGCGGAAADPGPADAGSLDGGPPDVGAADAEAPDAGTPFALASSAFAEGGTIPTRHECGPPLVPEGPGSNVSPALAWTLGPAGTASYAIVARDRDAGDLVHWVLYDIPPTVLEIAEGVPAGHTPAFPPGARQAELQGSGYFGYLGPCSPDSVNTYEWTVHALGTATLPGATRASTEDALADAIESMSIARASLSGES